jgi:hypothetical protein
VEIDATATAVEGEFDAVMQQPLRVEPRREPNLAHKPDCSLLQHAGPHARQHMRLADALEDQRIDADAVQELAEQQARRPRSDDDDLLPHPLGSTASFRAV